MSAIYDDQGNFVGHVAALVADHHTVGSHRAYSLRSVEWCYPADPCAHCYRAIQEGVT